MTLVQPTLAINRLAPFNKILKPFNTFTSKYFKFNFEELLFYIEGLVQNYLTTSFYIRSYNSFAPSPRYILDAILGHCK